jgi:hypothetical protein
MTKCLNLDEMLDVIELLGLGSDPFKGELEAIGDRMAAIIAAKLNVNWGPTHREESAFAGTCATFTRSSKDQPCPEPLDMYDQSEWTGFDDDEDSDDTPPQVYGGAS